MISKIKNKRIKSGINNFFPKNRKAAMEMSVGTIVTIVLLMGVLVMGILLIQRIGKSSTNAIDSVDAQVQSQINKLFSEEGNLVIYPQAREITLKKGDTPKGFAFSVKNSDVESHQFNYNVETQDVTGCGSLTKEKANAFLRPSSGSFSLGPGSSLSQAEMVKFVIPATAPPCTIIYRLNVNQEQTPYESATVFVTIK